MSSEHEDNDPLIGRVIDDRFRLDGLLGAGGMGRVYRGTQLSIERDVAIKLLRNEVVPDRNLRQRFMREARVISGFSHPNIVRLIDFGQDDQLGAPYLVMEMLGGLPLGTLIERGRLAPPLALAITRQVCTGLLEAHGAGIVHRDLKPDNIQLLRLSDGSLQVKILDFGIAYPRDANETLTQTGMIFGTAAYMAPEQAREGEADGQADLYAMGVILFEMLTGRRPFAGPSDFEIVLQQVQAPPPPLTNHLPESDLQPGLVELVEDLLAKDPRARPSGAKTVRRRVDELIGRLEGPELELDPSRPLDEAFEPFVLPAKTIVGDTGAGENVREVEMADTAAPAGWEADEEVPEPASEGEDAGTGWKDARSDAPPAAHSKPQQPQQPEQPARRALPTEAPPKAGLSRKWLIGAASAAAVVLLAGGAAAGLYWFGGDSSADTPREQSEVNQTKQAEQKDEDEQPETPDEGAASAQPAQPAQPDEPPAKQQAAAAKDEPAEEDTPGKSDPAPKQAAPDEKSGRPAGAERTDEGTEEPPNEANEASGGTDDAKPTGEGARAAGTDDTDDTAPAEQKPGRAAEKVPQEDSSAGSGLAPKWKKRRQAVYDKCRGARRGIQENTEEYKALAEAKKYDEMQAFAKEMQTENRELSSQMQEAGDDLSALIQDMIKAGVDQQHIQELSRGFSDACQDK